MDRMSCVYVHFPLLSVKLCENQSWSCRALFGPATGECGAMEGLVAVAVNYLTSVTISKHVLNTAGVKQKGAKTKKKQNYENENRRHGNISKQCALRYCSRYSVRQTRIFIGCLVVHIPFGVGCRTLFFRLNNNNNSKSSTNYSRWSFCSCYRQTIWFLDQFERWCHHFSSHAAWCR